MTLPSFARCVCSLMFVALTGASQAADRGLALTIGTPSDRAAVAGLFGRLGFDGPLRELSARDLTLRGLRAALGQLARETEAGDRVFLYFNGLGAARPARGGACEPAWRAHDGRVLPPAELNRAVQSLADRAAQVVVVVDAAPPPGRGNCASPGSWFAGVPADAASRMVVLAASGSGAATPALLGCLGQPDFSRNPLATFDDLQRCAAARAGQRLVLSGNAALPVQPRLAAMVPPSADLGRETPVAALRRAAANADARWRVSAAPAGKQGGAGAVSVTSDRDGYLYVVRAGTEAADLSFVYPQHADEPNRLQAGQGFALPRPAGSGDQLMVLVSERPMRSGDLLVQLGLAPYAAAACLRNLGGDDCPSTAAGASEGPAALHFGATLLSADGSPAAAR